VPNSEIEFRVGRLESQVADLNLAVEQMERRISADEGFKRAATN